LYQLSCQEKVDPTTLTGKCIKRSRQGFTRTINLRQSQIWYDTRIFVNCNWVSNRWQ